MYKNSQIQKIIAYKESIVLHDRNNKTYLVTTNSSVQERKKNKKENKRNKIMNEEITL